MTEQVTIGLKVGARGGSTKTKGRKGTYGVYQGVMHLDDSVFTVDASLTWGEAIYQTFGVELDPKVFYVKRQKFIAWGSPLLRHEVTEPIQKMLQDNYKKKTLKCKVCLIAKKCSHDARKLPTKPLKESTFMRHAKNKEYRTKIQRKAAVKAMEEANRVAERLSRLKISKDDESTPKKSSRKNYLTCKNKRADVKSRRNKFPSMCNDKPEVIKERDDNTIGSMLLNNAKTSPQLQKDDAIVEVEEEDEIDYEDILDEVYNRAMRIDNAELLKVRDELNKLKDWGRGGSSKDIWCEWSMMCPYPVQILRSLFDL